MLQFDLYTPGIISEKYDNVQLIEELGKIREAIAKLSHGRGIVFYREPEKREVGILACADGTDWNPGGGAGYYEYTGLGTNGWRMVSSGAQY